MYKYICKILLVLMVVCFLNGCNSNSKISLNRPDTISIYRNGNKVEVDNKSEYFDKILNATNSRFGGGLSVVKLSIHDEDISAIKGYELSVEFEYTEEQKLDFQNRGIKFKKLMFPIKEGDKSKNYLNLMIYSGEKYDSGPIGDLKSSSRLEKIISEIK